METLITYVNSNHMGFLPLSLQRQMELTNPLDIPDKWGILFRYDPAVLIVSIRLPSNVHSFGKLLRDRLYLSYFNNEKSVRPILLSAKQQH